MPSTLIASWAFNNIQAHLGKYLICPKRVVTHHIEGGKHVTVVVIGLQIFRDISKRGEVFWVLGSTGDITDFMLGNYVLGKDDTNNH